MKILLAEDDPNLGLLLKDYLEAKDFKVTLAKDGNEALDIFLKEEIEFCILDVMMPKKDGFSLAKEIRIKDSNVPLIFLTAKSMKDDTIKGLKIGADDYLTKPFSMEELLLRIKAIKRRTSTEEVEEEPDFYELGLYKFFPQVQQLEIGGERKKLTTKETHLLKLFSQKKNQPISRSFALKLIWGDDSYFNARSMDVYITKLRKLLKEDESLKILNLHGEGFKLIC